VVLIPDLSAPDKAYPEVMKLLPVGLKGLVFAALIAAIVSSLASMTNSISTIFTMDMYSHFSKKHDSGQKSQKHLVRVGRTVAFTAMLTAMILARPLLGNFDQAFQYIQEFTGFFTPGIVAIFLLAIFWKKTTANGALGAAIGSAILSLSLKLFWPALPFIDRVGLVFLFCVALGMLISYAQDGRDQEGAIEYAEIDTSTSSGFNFASLVIILMLTGLYIAWW
jgi:SSS family solute:Na+ symporter